MFNLVIHPASWLKVFGQGMDARSLEKSPAIPPYQNTWDIRQAYLEHAGIDKPGRPPRSLHRRGCFDMLPWYRFQSYANTVERLPGRTRTSATKPFDLRPDAPPRSRLARPRAWKVTMEDNR